MENILINHSGNIRFHPYEIRLFFQNPVMMLSSTEGKKNLIFFWKAWIWTVKCQNTKCQNNYFYKLFSTLFFYFVTLEEAWVSSPFLTFLAHFTERKYEVHAYIMRNTYTSSTKTKWNCKWSQFHEIFKYQSDFLKTFLIYVECHTYNSFNLMWDIPMSTGQINEGVVHNSSR